MKTTNLELEYAIDAMRQISKQSGRNLQMPGDGRYQPDKLKPFFGYDQWAGWLIIVEWFWMKTLAKIGAIPQEDAKHLMEGTLFILLSEIKTTDQDRLEKETKHDILALLALMRKHLPIRLHRWLHFCATSYDIINTAYALQLKTAFEWMFILELRNLSEIWRKKIQENAEVIQAGRTHLQTALPVTVGFWLANLHNRFASSSRKAMLLAEEIPGKFSGAVGTSASQRVLIKSKDGEKVLMKMLGLPVAEVSTQITPPEGMARFYYELVLLSGALANLGEDARILQSSQFGELVSHSSSSSAMSHKKANPIAAENIAGMHTTVIAEFMKIPMTLVSDLQRDLRWSNVMRSYSAIAVYVFQQITTATRLINSLKIDENKAYANFNSIANLVVAEVLHLSLQCESLPDAHHFINKEIVPKAETSGQNLWIGMEKYCNEHGDKEISMIWKKISKDEKLKECLLFPHKYIGDAIKIAQREAENKL